jgi:hypothetical protein
VGSESIELDSLVAVLDTGAPILCVLAGQEKDRATIIVELSASLQLGPEFAGLSRPATIGGVEFDILLPDFDTGTSGFPVKLPPGVREDWIPFFRGRDPDYERGWPFGSVRSWSGDGPAILEFLAHRLFALPKGPVGLSELDEVRSSVDGWARLVEEWVEVGARTDLHRDVIKVADVEGQTGFIQLDRGDDRPRPFRHLHRDDVQDHLTITFGGPLTLSPDSWGAILAKASEGRRPPEPHLFILDARRALNADHHRRSVLDSATAAEIALARLRDEAVRNGPTGLAEYIRKNVTEIKRLAGFLKTVGVEIPENITERIAQPRNKAIHLGHELDFEIATKALGKAEEIVDLAFPVDTLLST